MKITLSNPRLPTRSDLRPVEALLWDALAGGPDEQDIEPGVFLGLPEARLVEALANLAGLGYLSGEGIAASRPAFQYSEGVQRMGAAKIAADRRGQELANMRTAESGPGPAPKGFVAPGPPLRPEDI